MCIKVLAFVIHDSWKLINMNYIEAFMLKNSPSSKRTAIFFLVLSLAQGFDVCFEVCCDLWERAVMCVPLTLSRWSVRAPGPSYTALQLGRSSSPPSWRVPLPCCCAESLLPAVSAHAEHMPPLQLCGNKHMVAKKKIYSLPKCTLKIPYARIA